MSVYAQMEGTIRYTDRESFNRAIKLLTDNLWIVGKSWKTESGDSVDDSCEAYNEHELLITIPRSYYRNLLYVSEQLISGANAEVKWTSTDGMFEGGYLGKEPIDLENWAKEHGLDPSPDGSRGMNEDYYDKLVEWQEYVCDEFMCHG